MKYFSACIALLIGAGMVSADDQPTKSFKVPFDLLITKHIVVNIKINGKGPYRVIFDTGSPISLINTRTAKATNMLGKNNQPGFSLFGPVSQTNIQTLEIGNLKAKAVPVIVMNHPTVELISEALGGIEGIIGFPFFARYVMTLDYKAKEMTFIPNSFKPTDILVTLMETLMARDKPVTKVFAPSGLWGLEIEKKGDDKEPGVKVARVNPGSSAASAGLQVGDRILILDDYWTDTVEDCYTAAGQVNPGRTVVVSLKRQETEKKILIKPEMGL